MLVGRSLLQLEVAPLTKLHHHLAVISSHIVLVQLGLVSNTSQETRLFLMIFVLRLLAILLGDLCLHFLDCLENPALDNGHNSLEKEVYDLRRDGEIDDLLLEPVRVQLEGLGLYFAVGSETLGGDLENVEVRYQDLRKRNIHKCCQEDGKVGHDEVDHKDLLDDCCLVC